MFIHKELHDAARIFERRTRAANVFAFVRERYNCVKYKNNPYDKGALLWASLPIVAKNSPHMNQFKKHLIAFINISMTR